MTYLLVRCTDGTRGEVWITAEMEVWDMSLPRHDQRFNYSDYLAWSDDERWELIDGEPHNIKPCID